MSSRELQRKRGPDRALAVDTGLGIGFGILYFVLLVTLGILSLRKGHSVMFIIGIFFPLFWLIGALIPRRQPGQQPPALRIRHTLREGTIVVWGHDDDRAAPKPSKP